MRLDVRLLLGRSMTLPAVSRCRQPPRYLGFDESAGSMGLSRRAALLRYLRSPECPLIDARAWLTAAAAAMP